MGLNAYELSDAALLMQYGLVERLLQEEELKPHRDWALVADANEELSELYLEIERRGLEAQLAEKHRVPPGFTGKAPIRRRRRS